MSEKLVKCPFNPSHIISESALQRHIIRCMVNYPNFVACPYNALHRFPNKEVLAKHLLECDASKIQIYDDSKEPFSTDIHIDNIRNFNLELENWDA